MNSYIKQVFKTSVLTFSKLKMSEDSKSIKPSNVVSDAILSISISLFILLKVVELILKQINQHRNYNQQTEKINLMNSNSSVSEEEMTKKIYKVVQALRTT